MPGNKRYNRKLNIPTFKNENGKSFKLCSKCLEYKEMTNDFFSTDNKMNCKFKSCCKECNLNKKINHFNKEGDLICRKCLDYKNINEFYTGYNLPGRLGRSSLCKICESKKKKEYRSDIYYESLDILLSNLLKGSKSRTIGVTKKGSARGKNFNIDLEYLKDLYNNQKGKCSISGIDMTFIIGKGRQLYNISLDRIDNNLGYEKGNIQLVCNIVNIMKNTLSLKELISICTNIIENNCNESKNF